MSVNPTAATGFERGADAYERARPSYPPAVLEHLPSSGTIVDVAAGTGKLTRLLPGSVIAVEPVVAMRAVAAQHAPTVAALAEHLPLRTGCADAITVAQAFHWFDFPRALDEVARVLRPGGTLLLAWNDRDERVPWVEEYSAIVHAHDNRAYGTDLDWPAIIGASPHFGAVEVRTVDNPQIGMTADLIVERAMSTSYIAAADDEVRAEVARQVRAIVADFDEPFDLPYVTHIFTCTRS